MTEGDPTPDDERPDDDGPTGSGGPDGDTGAADSGDSNGSDPDDPPDDGPTEGDATGDPSGDARSASGRWPPDRATALAVAAGLAFVAAVRLIPVGDVFVGGEVVLSSNDPYLYRHLVERVAAAAGSPLDLPTLIGHPLSAGTGEPLLVAVLAFASELLGGSRAAVGWVLALYPVVAAVATGGLVYLLGRALTGDVRVGLAALGLYAVVPGNAFRTAVGFADHHAFDYFWLALTALCLVVALSPVASRRDRLLAGGGLAAGVAGTALAWESGPLLLVPVAVGLAAATPLLARAGRERHLGPVVAGLGGAAAVVWAAHLGAGWHGAQPAVAVVPTALFAGGAALAGLAYAVDRAGLPPAAVPAAEAVGLAAAVGAVALVPSLSGPAVEGASRVLRSSTIAETTGLAASLGPLVGPTVMLGFALLLGLPVVAWGVVRAYRADDPRWAVAAAYALYLLALALAQRRFVGELAPVMAAFAGVGFVWLLSWLEVLAPVPWSPTGDAARDPDPVSGVAVPDRRRLVAVGGLSALFLGFPSAFTAVIGSRATTDRRRYAAARWMREYAERRGWSPSNRYVLSEWGENRMYNYFVAGRSRSYGYAQRNYGRFLFSTNPGEWYDRLKGRVRFVVVEGRPVDLPPYSTYDTLFERFGSAGERAPGLAHYRAVYADRAAGIVAFTLVPGATIEGRTDGTGTVAVSTEVTLPEASFTYERRVRPDADGSYAVRVPYPGAYRVDGRRVVVEEAAVEDGRRVPVE